MFSSSERSTLQTALIRARGFWLRCLFRIARIKKGRPESAQPAGSSFWNAQQGRMDYRRAVETVPISGASKRKGRSASPKSAHPIKNDQIAALRAP
jgi:hypothetical protein